MRKCPSLTLAIMVLSLVSCSSGPEIQKGRFAPRDECTAIAGAPAFLDQVRSAVEARDTNALLPLVTPDVRLDAFGGAGPDVLRDRLDSGQFELWESLAPLMQLGCAPTEDGGIVLPWYYAQDLGTDDPYNTMITRGEDVPLYREKTGNSEVLETLSWEVVQVKGEIMPEDQRAQVATPSGGTGYIAIESLRGKDGLRILADRIDGQWRITELVSGP